MWTVLSTPDVTVVCDPAADSSRGHAHDVLIRAVCADMRLDPAAVAVVHHCPRCGATDHGVPGLVHRRTPLALTVSVSRAAGVVLVGWGGVPGLGVDVERAGAAADPALDDVLRHPDEPAPGDAIGRTQAWVRKEAALKAWGSGLNVEPSRVRLTAGSATADSAPDPVDLTDLVIPGHQACVALRLGGQ